MSDKADWERAAEKVENLTPEQTREAMQELKELAQDIQKYEERKRRENGQ